MSFPTLPPGVKVVGVGELTRAIKGLLEETFQTVWVAGEISNLARPASGHVYFKLKDAEGLLNAVMWRGVALRLRFDVKDGLEVIARGRISVYAPRGEYQLSIEDLHPKGIGAQELALRQLKEKLFRLGYFDKKRKRPLPAFPRSIALITSPTGAAVRDMLEILGRRWPSAQVYVCPAKMQGEGSSQEVAGALRYLNRLRFADAPPLDVIIIGRGGGSTEDLSSFNEEIVAQAIFQSAIPVVSAVGHEIDVTIADMVADFRALTPSEAAEAVAPDRLELMSGLNHLGERMRGALLQQLELSRRRLNDLAGRRLFRQPLERICEQEQRLDDWGQRLQRAIGQRLVLNRKRFEGLAGKLAALSPLNVLSRGYSLTRKSPDRAVVRNADQVQPGEQLETILQHGRLLSRVEEVHPPEPADVAPDHGGSLPVRMRS